MATWASLLGAAFLGCREYLWTALALSPEEYPAPPRSQSPDSKILLTFLHEKPHYFLVWRLCRHSGLQSMGSLRVGHNSVTSLSLFTFMHWRRKWQPTPVFLSGESQGWRSLVGCCLWGRRVRHDWSDLAAAAAADIVPGVEFWLHPLITVQFWANSLNSRLVLFFFFFEVGGSCSVMSNSLWVCGL